MMSDDNPRDAWELSRHRYEQALARVEAAVTAGCPPGDPDLLNEMRIIRMVGITRAPWYGMIIDPEDSSVDVGVMMRNAFEAVGDHVDYPTDKGLETRARHYFTLRYLPLWRRGKREYHQWLDTLSLQRPPEREAPGD
jgi:hypothetical protein